METRLCTYFCSAIYDLNPHTHTHPLEMRPQWFKHVDIPYDDMWPDDILWFPYLLGKKYFDAFVKFEGHDTILDYTITEKQ